MRTSLTAPTARRRFVAPLAIGVVCGVATVFGWLPLPADAQIRPVPAGARLGVLKVGTFPEAELDGRPIRLGAGARIRNTENLIVVPSTVRGVAHPVAFVTGPTGEIVEAWILSDAELKRLRARRAGS